MSDIEVMKRDKQALSDLHARLGNITQNEYNALVHAIWRLDNAIAKEERE